MIQFFHEAEAQLHVFCSHKAVNESVVGVEIDNMYGGCVQPNLSQTPLVDVDSQSGSATPVNSPTTDLNLHLVNSVLTDIQGL